LIAQLRRPHLSVLFLELDHEIALRRGHGRYRVDRPRATQLPQFA
jgi:hypothetical protein